MAEAFQTWAELRKSPGELLWLLRTLFWISHLEATLVRARRPGGSPPSPLIVLT